MIANLQQLIEARDKQMGGKMIETTEPAQEEQKTDSGNKEVVETMKLLFTYIRQTMGQINQDINIIKQQQQEILKKLEDKIDEE